MAYQTVRLKSGVNVEMTETQNEAGISVSNLIRFKGGLPQKLGGWSRFYLTALSSVPRALHAWEDLEAQTHLAIGADNYLGVVTNGTLTTITPEQNTLNFAPSFITVAGSPNVAVYVPGSSVGIGDIVSFATPVSVGGIILSGAYPVFQANGPDIFTIQAGSNATSSVNVGGTVPVFSMNLNSATVTVSFPNHGYSVGSTFAAIAPTSISGITIQGFYTISAVLDANTFQFPTPALSMSAGTAAMNGGNAEIIDYLAPSLNDLNSGYGIGGYGQGGYGSGFAIPIHTGQAVAAPSWSLDNYGELLVACPRGGPIFLWGPTKGVLYAEAIAQGPVANGGIFVAMPEQIIVAWGASQLGIRDPLLIRWCDVGNYSSWTATVTNQAGSFRLPRGSAIIGGMQASQQALLWTDLALWSMTYVGPQLVFGFNEIAAGCGLIAQHAAVEQGSAIYWMSQKGFFSLSGGAVQPIDCPVWDFIFQNMNPASVTKVCAGANSQFDEVTWFFASTASAGENDSYVKLNTLTGEWDYGMLARSAWTDQSVLGPAIGASPIGVIYQHETSPDADGSAMDSYIETGFFMVGEGEDFTFIDECIPDFKLGFFGQPQTAQMQITLKGADTPVDPVRVYGPYNVATAGSTTAGSGGTRFTMRARARYFSMRFESNDVGSFWRLGGVKFRAAPDGRA